MIWYFYQSQNQITEKKGKIKQKRIRKKSLPLARGEAHLSSRPSPPGELSCRLPRARAHSCVPGMPWPSRWQLHNPPHASFSTPACPGEAQVTFPSFLALQFVLPTKNSGAT